MAHPTDALTLTVLTELLNSKPPNHKEYCISANKYENATIAGIFIFISRENFMLSWVEHEKSFINSGPGFALFATQPQSSAKPSGDQMDFF